MPAPRWRWRSRCPSPAGRPLHGWPFLGVGGADVGGKTVGRSPLGFLLQQALFVGPASAPVWLAGLWRLAVRPPRPGAARPGDRLCRRCWRSSSSPRQGLLRHADLSGRCSPPAPSPGSVAQAPAARAGRIAVVVIPGLVAAPTVLPILPPDALVAYMRAIGFSPKATQTESMKLRRCRSISPTCSAGARWRRRSPPSIATCRRTSARRRCSSRRNYGEAAALDVYGRRSAARRRSAATIPISLGAARRVRRGVITLGRDAARFDRRLWRRPRRRPHRQRLCDALRERPDDLGSAPAARAARRSLAER